MKRNAFRMRIKPGCEDEYERRHRDIWPELKQLLLATGIRNYSIYLDRATGALFAYQEVVSDQGSQDLADNPVVQKWWKHMKDIMETNPDYSPVSIPLEEVFHLDPE